MRMRVIDFGVSCSHDDRWRYFTKKKCHCKNANNMSQKLLLHADLLVICLCLMWYVNENLPGITQLAIQAVDL